MRFRTLTRATATVLAFATLCLTAACGPVKSDGEETAAQKLPPLTSLTPVEDPSKVEGPVTAVMPEVSIEPIDHGGVEQKLPTTVTSHPRTGDKEVTVESTERIVAVSLNGGIAQYVYGYGFGENMVGRDVSTNLPGLEDLPAVTKDGHSIDAESVLALNPTLVLTDGTIGPTDVIEQLGDAGVPVVFVSNSSTFEEGEVQAQEVADALGISAAGEHMISHVREQIAAKQAEIQKLLPADKSKLPRVAFLYIRGKGIFYMFGEGSTVASLYEPLGVIDVAKEIGWKGMRPMNDEALVEANPDTILVMTGGLESVGGIEGLMEAHPAVALTAAGKSRHIIDVPDAESFSGGMRSADTLDGLARAIYAPDSLRP